MTGQGEAWQYKVKKSLRVREPSPPEAELLGAAVIVRAIAAIDARPFIERNEWIGNEGAAKYRFGLYVGSHLAGVACFSTPAAPRALERLLGSTIRGHVFLLCRGASTHWAPTWVGSRLLSAAMRMMHRQYSAKVILAYADPQAGEIGVVYQAANGLYLGRTDSRGPGHYVIGGVRYHARAVPKKFGSAAHAHLVAIDPAYERHQRTKKHRYAFVVCRGAERSRLLVQLAPLLQPFPRRQGTEPVSARLSTS